MAWSGGTFTRVDGATGWQDDEAAGTGIEAGLMDTAFNDLATDGINQSLNKAGQNTPTADLPMGGYKHTNIAAGTAAAPAFCAGNDSDTGIFSSGANKWALSTGGTERLSVDSSGNALLGTAGATTTNRLVVTGTGQAGTITDAGNKDASIRITSGGGSTNDGGQLELGAGWGTFTQSYFAAIKGLLSSGSGNTTGHLAFYTRNATGDTSLTERMRILANGRVGVGTSAPGVEFQIGDGTTYQRCEVAGTSSGAAAGGYFAVRNGANLIMAIGNASGIIGGAYDNSPTLYGNGVNWKVINLTAGAGTHTMKWSNTANTWTYDTSSQRYKENIRDSKYGLNAVLAMKSRQYNYIEGKNEDVGFIAEELVDVIPELVALNDKDQPDAVSYDRLTSVLCKAIQELNAKVEALEEKVATLEAQVAGA